MNVFCWQYSNGLLSDHNETDDLDSDSKPLQLQSSSSSLVPRLHFNNATIDHIILMDVMRMIARDSQQQQPKPKPQPTLQSLANVDMLRIWYLFKHFNYNWMAYIWKILINYYHYFYYCSYQSNNRFCFHIYRLKQLVFSMVDSGIELIDHNHCWDFFFFRWAFLTIRLTHPLVIGD